MADDITIQAATPAEAIQADTQARLARLSRRQREVLVLTSKGMTVRETAAVAGMSPGTVNDHRKAIFRKLDVSSAVEAAVIAAKAGLV